MGKWILKIDKGMKAEKVWKSTEAVAGRIRGRGDLQ